MGLDPKKEREIPEKGSLFVTILIAIILIAIAAIIGYNFGQVHPVEEKQGGQELYFRPTKLGKELHLNDSEVSSRGNLQKGWIDITIQPGEGFVMPEKTHIEAFAVEGGEPFGISSESPADEAFGKTLSHDLVDEAYDINPYALSLGKMLKQFDGTNTTYTLSFEYQHSFVPYDIFVLTLESEKNKYDYDPRPAAIIYKADVLENYKPIEAVEEENDAEEAQNKNSNDKKNTP
ncbi:hypothetical protein ACFL2D_02195 [Patescibacteria group bacterium]